MSLTTVCSLTLRQIDVLVDGKKEQIKLFLTCQGTVAILVENTMVAKLNRLLILPSTLHSRCLPLSFSSPHPLALDISPTLALPSHLLKSAPCGLIILLPQLSTPCPLGIYMQEITSDCAMIITRFVLERMRELERG